MATDALVIQDPPMTIPADMFGLDGFLRWVHSKGFPDGRRASFLAGEVHVELSREEILTENLVKGALYCDLGVWADRGERGRVFADGALLVNDATGLATEPNSIFCLWDTLQSGRVRLAEIIPDSGRFVEVRGSPDLVVEIVSDSSVRKDTVLLPELYYAAGVREYWMIDARRAKIDFRLLTRTRGRFMRVKRDAQGYRRSRVLHGMFRMTRKKVPIGGFQYRLLAKSDEGFHHD